MPTMLITEGIQLLLGRGLRSPDRRASSRSVCRVRACAPRQAELTAGPTKVYGPSTNVSANSDLFPYLKVTFVCIITPGPDISSPLPGERFMNCSRRAGLPRASPRDGVQGQRGQIARTRPTPPSVIRTLGQPNKSSVILNSIVSWSALSCPPTVPSFLRGPMHLLGWPR